MRNDAKDDFDNVPGLRADVGDDATLKILCAEVFRSVGQCEAVADTSRDHD